MGSLKDIFKQAADLIESHPALLIGAGAGMGVDSGLPDFRGLRGFWQAYPVFAKQRRSLQSLATPRWFEDDPETAWGFYGHRIQLYQETEPHEGFQILKALAESRPGGFFVYTSNVDSHFQRAGFPEERIVECHGSLAYLQQRGVWSGPVWPRPPLDFELDLEQCLAKGALPTSAWGELLRPNVLLFNDEDWNSSRMEQQILRYRAWHREHALSDIVALELGAGLAVPTVRFQCFADAQALIRINPNDHDVAEGHLAVPCGALEALRGIAEHLL